MAEVSSVQDNQSLYNKIDALYPPTDEPTPPTLANTVLLLACFTIGIAGNASQLALQIYTNRFAISQPSELSQYYISILHVVYFLISIALPSVIIENLVNMWMFGMVTCASHFILVTSGRAVIGWIVVFIVADQAILHCQLWSKLKRVTHRSAFIASLIFLFVFVALIVAPSLFFIKVTVYEEYGLIPNFRIDTYTCSTILPKHLSLYTNAFALIFDYILPITIVIVLITVFLGKVNTRRNSSSHVNQWKINSFIMLLATLHFFAYLPHWTAILLLFVAENWSLQMPDWVLVVLKQLVLLLPHLTAAFAWIPLSSLSTLLADRARSMYSESYGKFTRQKRQTGVWAEESVF
ncbi:hypothetical protein QR680_002799 [Steinernema hermaphroditum]|uniref:G-protein coupled receptors family 1 profile domain-containing protein n=1 Tax=Steinernema hermaphroditum TaxID=289476 RepID=A0AA39H508_9BILA|nr:hypothetical protein QR680_002799 [Steinernema hermaphroditum]